MSFQTFDAKGTQRRGYLTLPPSGKGPGLLLLHAWWGLTGLFTGLADRFAAEGFVVFAPDMHDGKQTAEIAEAEKLVGALERDFPAAVAKAKAALEYLQNHSAVTSKKQAAVGFSMGAAYAYILDKEVPEAFDRIVLFYGMPGVDISKSQARYLGHYAEDDPYEPSEGVQNWKADNLQAHVYPGTGHWFFEDNRPDAYNAEAAKLAWQRTLAFLKE